MRNRMPNLKIDITPQEENIRLEFTCGAGFLTSKSKLEEIPDYIRGHVEECLDCVGVEIEYHTSMTFTRREEVEDMNKVLDRDYPELFRDNATMVSNGFPNHIWCKDCNNYVHVLNKKDNCPHREQLLAQRMKLTV